PTPPPGSTEWGMPQPSMAAPGTLREGADPDPATAPTVASDPGHVHSPATRRSAPGGVPGQPGALSGPYVDRNAETRASAGQGHTQRLAQNGRWMDEGAPPLGPEEALWAAFGEQAPLEVPPLNGPVSGPVSSGRGPSGEMVFAQPSTGGASTGATG